MIVRHSRQNYMVLIGILGQVLFYAQAYKIFSLKSAEDLSLLGFIISAIAMINWLIYGLKIHDKPLIISNIVGCIGVATVIAGILFYA